LRDAHAAVANGDPGRALVLLDRHAAQFPNGILAEECVAERIVALCGLGRTSEGRSETDRFLREHPRSPLAARVRAACVAR
jgi:hypothetical protein